MKLFDKSEKSTFPYLAESTGSTERTAPKRAGFFSWLTAESLKIYTMPGTLVADIDLKTNSDDLPLDISRFPAGTYIITLQADGNTVLHQKLVKK